MSEETKMANTILKRVLAGCLIAAAAGGAIYAELKNGYYRPSELGSIQQAAPREFSPNSNYEIPAYTLYMPELAEGEGREEVKQYCNMCHGPRYISMQPPLPAATWEAEVNKMRKGYGASIPDEAAQKIIQYLAAHYTPETRKE